MRYLALALLLLVIAALVASRVVLLGAAFAIVTATGALALGRRS